jgi:UDP-GlcNAc:undecaprenyl-phosphate GlcNAc-1-phosphate transferase
MDGWAAWLLPALAALAGAILLCPLAIALAPSLRFIDRPGAEAHKQQARPVPYGGGIAIALALAAAWSLAALWPLPTPGVGDALRQVPILLGALALVLLGAWDDARPLRPWQKLLAQAAVAAAVVHAAGLQVDFLRPYAPLDFIAAWGWLVVISNAYNLLDHADGLCGSVAVVGLAALAGGAALSGDQSAARMWACCAAALAGFLLWNRPPARIYMGDAGSLAIGFLIGCGTLATTFWPSQDGGSALALVSPLLICFVPLFDAAAVTVKRLRRGAPIMRGDRNHISHRLNRLGVGPMAVLAVVVALQAALAASTFQLRDADPLAAILNLSQAAAICVALIVLETARDHG